MRVTRAAATLSLLVLPMLGWSMPSHADSQGSLLDQAQRLLGGNSDANNDRERERDRAAYERGREDERRAAARHERGVRDQEADRDDWNSRDRASDRIRPVDPRPRY